MLGRRLEGAAATQVVPPRAKPFMCVQVLNKNVEQEIVSVKDDVDKNGALKTPLREWYGGSSGAPGKTLEVSVDASRLMQTLEASAARGPAAWRW